MYHVLHQAAEQGLHWENLRRIVLGGEKVPDGMRLKLRRLAAELGSPNADVLVVYGFTEWNTFSETRAASSIARIIGWLSRSWRTSSLRWSAGMGKLT